MAKTERIDPKELSWRSVMEAMPTPTSKRKRENLIFRLQIRKEKFAVSLENPVSKSKQQKVSEA